MKASDVKYGKVYRHCNGGLYRVTGIVTDANTMDKVVIYENFCSGKEWCRPLKEFCGMHRTGVPRFTEVES